MIYVQVQLVSDKIFHKPTYMVIIPGEFWKLFGMSTERHLTS